MKASELFTIPADFPFGEFFSGEAAPWEWVPAIAAALAGFSWPADLPDLPGGVSIEGRVYFGKNVRVPPHCTIVGPVYIGDDCEIRPGAYIRGNVIAGRGCVLGNSCEFKNCLLLEGVQAAHFNYVGDSILGGKAHLGAGVILSNLRLDQKEVPVVLPDGKRTGSGLKKLGGLVGDAAEIGCNAVLQPGTILGRRSLVMPSMAFGGFLPGASIAKSRQTVSIIPRRDF